MFLAAMGLGLGGYVDRSTDAVLGGVPYLAFLAPGLLVATCMQAAAFEATFPIMAGLVWSRVYHAMFATPISPRDIALGNILWFGRPTAADRHGLHGRHRRCSGRPCRRSSCWPSPSPS